VTIPSSKKKVFESTGNTTSISFTLVFGDLEKVQVRVSYDYSREKLYWSMHISYPYYT